MSETTEATGAKEPYPWLANYPESVDWNAEIPVKPLYDLLDHGVATYAKNIAIDFLGKTYTYEEIGDLVRRAAKGLQGLGVGKGVQVGLFLPNSPYYVILYFAILKTGATVVNFNPLYVERELIHQIEDSEVDLMVTLDLKILHEKLAPLMDRTRLARLVICKMADVLPFPKNLLFPVFKGKEIASIPSDSRHVRFAELIANDGAYTPVDINPETDIALLQYTGGTTGVPKGAMLTHKNVYANAIQGYLWFEQANVKGSITSIGVLPLFHVLAMTVIMNYSVYTGSKMVLLPRFEMEQLLATITRTKPDLFTGVPTLFSAINTYPNLDKYDLSSLKYCLSGGAGLPVEVKQRFEEITGCRLFEGYGLSECSPIAAANPIEGENKPGSIGLPCPATVIEIVSIEDGETVMPVGEKGEICIRGPQVMAGYWKRPDATAETIRNGRLHTGDVGTMDAQGYTYIVDRLKEVILAGGYNVYPRNVEEAIYMHPAVAEAAVIGVPDPYRGQTVKAFVTLAEGASLSEEELTDFLKDKLSAIEMPKLVEFRDELPKSAIGKILKKVLVAEEMKKTEGAKTPG